jgi:hypothetical protein
MIIETKDWGADIRANPENNGIIMDFYGSNNARIVVNRHDAIELAGTLIVLAGKITHAQMDS